MPSHDTTIEICGIEKDVTAEFTIKSMGSPPSYDPMYGADGGDDPEIELERVFYKDDPQQKDISDTLSNLRDLELRYHYGSLHDLRYGYGFRLQHGTFTAQCGNDFRLHVKHYKPKLVFNENRTLLDAVEMDVYENLHEYADYD